MVRGVHPDKPEVAAQREKQLAELKGAYSTALTGTIPQVGFPFNEGVQIRLEKLSSGWWCAFEPFTHVEFPRQEDDKGSNAEVDSTDIPFQSLDRGDRAIDWRRERWATRYNRTWAQIIAAWAKMLAGAGDSPLLALGLKNDEGLDAEFRLSPITAWSRPGHEHGYFIRGRS